jgi:DNA-binding transcriptional regulator YhcF (GntR family)
MPAGRTPLYLEIVEAIRQQILNGELQPGNNLPSVREMSAQWGCAPGTVQGGLPGQTQRGILPATSYGDVDHQG